MCTTRKTVLVVDDDVSIRETLAELLADEGYQVVTAANGRLALEELERMPPPCLILLDLMMPVMTGFEFYDELKQRPTPLSQTPVVVISADGNVRAKARALGGEYLPKPVKIDTVLATIDRHCA